MLLFCIVILSLASDNTTKKIFYDISQFHFLQCVFQYNTPISYLANQINIVCYVSTLDVTISMTFDEPCCPAPFLMMHCS